MGHMRPTIPRFYNTMMSTRTEEDVKAFSELANKGKAKLRLKTLLMSGRLIQTPLSLVHFTC